MPTYLCHGFRWHRSSIRIFVIIHDLEEAAPDWVIGYDSSLHILDQIHENFDFVPLPPDPADAAEGAKQPGQAGPDRGEEHTQKGVVHQDLDLSLPPPRVPDAQDAVLMHQWTPLRLLEEYDAAETAVATRPYAYLADYAVRIDLSVDVAAEMARYEAELKTSHAPWFGRLRDSLQQGEEIKWYVVVCDDEERAAPGDEDEELSDVDEAASSMDVDSVPYRPASVLNVAAPVEKTAGWTATGAANRDEHHGSGQTASYPLVPESTVGDQEQAGVKDAQRSSKTLKSKQSISKGLRRLLGKRDKV